MIVTTENYDYFTSDDFLEIFQRLDRPNVGLHNDTGNWLLLDEDPLEATRKVAPYTYHAHVRDYDLRDGVFTSVPIGQHARLPADSRRTGAGRRDARPICAGDGDGSRQRGAGGGGRGGA